MSKSEVMWAVADRNNHLMDWTIGKYPVQVPGRFVCNCDTEYESWHDAKIDGYKKVKVRVEVIADD